MARLSVPPVSSPAAKARPVAEVPARALDSKVQAGAEARPAAFGPTAQRGKLSDYATQLREKRRSSASTACWSAGSATTTKGRDQEGATPARTSCRCWRPAWTTSFHRMGFAVTRPAAPAGQPPRRDRERQVGQPAVVRGQGRRRDRPVGEGRASAARQESLTVAEQMDLSPSWVEVDANKFAGVFKAVPDRADLPATSTKR